MPLYSRRSKQAENRAKKLINQPVLKRPSSICAKPHGTWTPLTSVCFVINRSPFPASACWTYDERRSPETGSSNFLPLRLQRIPRETRKPALPVLHMRCAPSGSTARRSSSTVPRQQGMVPGDR